MARDAHAAGDEAGALETIETALSGDERFAGVSELRRPWAAAFYRDSVPDARAVLNFTREAFEPIFSQCSIREYRS